MNDFRCKFVLEPKLKKKKDAKNIKSDKPQVQPPPSVPIITKTTVDEKSSVSGIDLLDGVLRREEFIKIEAEREQLMCKEIEIPNFDYFKHLVYEETIPGVILKVVARNFTTYDDQALHKELTELKWS